MLSQNIHRNWQMPACACETHEKGEGLLDYGKYRFSIRELAFYSGLYLVLDGIVSLLFYRSWIAFAVLSPGLVLFLKEQNRNLRRRRLRTLESQFLTGIQAVSNALSAGYSVENAFIEAVGELRKVFAPKEDSVREFEQIARQLSYNRPLEGLLLDLANRSRAEDIESFAQVFTAARRSGGDLIAIIRNTVFVMTQKEETRREIQVTIASRKLEQNVMSAVPLFILAYVGLGSPGFLDTMYHSLAGCAVMTGCLLTYVGAWLLGRKIVDIEV